MNIITKSDTKKFISLLKAGLKNGTAKEMRTYSNATRHDGIDVAKDFYVALEFRFNILPEHIEDILSEDMMDNEIDDLLK